MRTKRPDAADKTRPNAPNGAATQAEQWLERELTSARYRRMSASTGNRHARRVVAALRRAAKLARAWVAEHGRNCECDYCTLSEYARDIWLDMVTAWKLAEGRAELIHSITTPTPEQQARHAERFDARRKAREARAARQSRPDADQPTIITEGKQS